MMPESAQPEFGSRRRTATVGAIVVFALVAAAALISKAPSRETADSLYWLTSTLIVAAMLAFLVTAISVLFRRRSLKFHIILAALAAAAALAAYPTSSRDQDLPVVFSWGIFTPVGTGVCIATVIVIASRTLFVNRAPRG